MSKHILILPGDGIGPEIVKAAEQVLTRVNEKFNLGLTWDQVFLAVVAIVATVYQIQELPAEKRKKVNPFL